ncbi:phage antirepressor [Clostridium cellulovorans]|jgi:anti-repressor protein|uniref:Prophage antirepressor n=1 Tax=Clostridium cellulovorans (strain ATCC 35296 / DSM 3052 / OCM 3 / 743B) TaxID=573061 RepID=D9SWH3_CLOC7|nr:phage antirepressor [Clostridium cellulovorans]ADL53255.1 prophage antirepressor [Clostridium cellulovorans 743B]
MNDLRIFTSEEFGQVRTVVINNEPWFIGKDVAEKLGYSNGRDALNKHVDEDDKGVANCDTPGGKQDLVIINESGLYSLILGSKLPNAKKFKKWVTSEVLPSIRKHGVYMTNDTIEKAITSPDFLIQLATNLKEEQQKRKLAEDKLQEQKPKVVFANAVAASHNSILVGELAKILKQNGVDVGQNRLFEWLRKYGYLIKRKGTDYNMPTQSSMELGLFEIKETSISHADGHVSISKTPKVTGKGQVYFINKFKS